MQAKSRTGKQEKNVWVGRENQRYGTRDLLEAMSQLLSVFPCGATSINR